MIGSILRVRYELVTLLSEGPIFGAYLARDRVASKEVTIRLLKPPFNTERSFVDALAASIRQSTGVNHPGVERIDEVDDDQGQPFLVGPHSPGVSLSERIHKLAPFSVPVSVGTAISILEGLDALHTAGVVHGDVSSHNIVVGADGSTRLQLAGIWRSYSHSSTAGAVVLPMLAAYLAPEISAGGLPSATSDVYAVGVLLYELLCGRLPYGAETPVAMAMKHATAPTPSIRTYCPSAPMVLDEIVKRTMQKDPTLRYKNAGALLSDLRLLQDALRFGRSLTWPLRPENPSTTGTPVGRGRPAPQEPVMQPVAPRMSAIRDVRQEKTRQSEYTGDVPLWIKATIGLLSVAIVSVIVTWFFLNLGSKRLIVVPSLLGRDVNEARAALRKIGLEMREVSRETSDTSPAQTILRTDPDAGDKVRENGIVSVVVSSGSRQVEVPTLRGLTVDNARTVLKSLDLDIATPIDRIADASPADTIVDQDPPPHQLVEKRTLLHIRVSNGTGPASNPTPPAPTDNPATTPANPDGADGTKPAADKPAKPVANNAENIYSLSIRLSDALTEVTVRVDVEDTNGIRTILEEPHDVNDVVTISTKAAGPTATFRIYYDGVLKRTIKRNAPSTTRRRRKPAAPPADPSAIAPPDDAMPKNGTNQDQN